MHIDQFVLELKKFTPSREVYEQFGYPESLIEKKLKKYECLPAIKPKLNVMSNSEILRLLNSYDCSNVEIGVLTFKKEVIETESYYIIGEVETDILALDKITLEIQVLDYTNPEHIIWHCAANSAYFLDAMLVCAEFFSRLLDKPSLAQDASFTYEYVVQSTEKAGGEKYIEYYRLLLGYW